MFARAAFYRARRSRSAAGINSVLTTHARITGLLCRRPKHCARAAITAPKSSWAPRAPHAQPMRVQRTVRPSGPISAPAARRGTASTGPRPTTSQSHRGVVVWTKNQHQHACAKTRGSFRGSRVCFACQSEAVFVSFVWVNSCRKDLKNAGIHSDHISNAKKNNRDKENIILLPVDSGLSWHRL